MCTHTPPSTHRHPCLRMLYITLFFFYWNGDHRDLHSFPTRRSSDLGGAWRDCAWFCDRSAQRPRHHGGSDVDRDHEHRDRKSTRLNSSHVEISYAVFCLKKKKNNKHMTSRK